MPLIMLSGFPCSGKSTRAAELEAFFKSRSKPVVIVSVPVDRNAVFASASAPEKAHRAAEFSAIKRNLNKDTVVIADGLNYIKGFRYQLFCEAKGAATTSCVVHVAAPVEKCREWNRARRERAIEAASTADLNAEGLEGGEPETAPVEQAYDEEVFDNLVFRYEEPNPMSRWDSPCFVVPWMDDQAPLEEIYKELFEPKSQVKTNKSTAPKPIVEGNYLYELDKVTQDVVALIMEHQKNSGGGGGVLPVPECSVSLELPDRQLALPQMQRLRRQFIQLNRTHTVAKTRIRELFVIYVNENI